MPLKTMLQYTYLSRPSVDFKKKEILMMLQHYLSIKMALHWYMQTATKNVAILYKEVL